MKVCSRCTVEKSFDDFAKNKSEYQAWCKACYKAYDVERYKKQKVKRKKQIRLQRERTRDFFIELKESNPCVDCHKFWPYYVMQFDHLPGFEKSHSVSTLARSGRMKMALEEIEKCELVCGNCHAVRTHNRLNAIE